MIWYNIQKNKGEYRVWKNAEVKNGIAFKSIFSGTKNACIKYCKDNNIKLGDKNDIRGTKETR